MTGLDEGRLLAYLDGEVDAGDRAAIDARLREDPETRHRLEAIRERARRVSGLLSQAPVSGADDERIGRVRSRVRAAVSGGHGTGGDRGWWTRRSRLAQAALLVLLLATGAAAATVPGSPLRSLLGDLLEGDAPTAAAPSGSVLPPGPELPVVEAGEEVGVRVRPADGRLVVVVAELPGEAAITVNLVERAQGAVFGPRGTRFRSGMGRIEATVAGSGPVRVEIPRSVAEASVRVGERIYFEKRGDRVELPGPEAAVSDGRYHFGR